jgi:hypothetical protein
VSWTKNAAGVPTRFKIALTPNTPGQLPYYPISSFKLTWQLLGKENRAFASGAQSLQDNAPRSLEGAVESPPADGGFRLLARLERPDGSIAMERMFTP